MSTEKIVKKASNPPLRKGVATGRNFNENERCECNNVPTYRKNAFGIYVCSECDKKLKDKDISTISSYYGW